MTSQPQQEATSGCVAIRAVGLHIPRYRLEGAEARRFWDNGLTIGSRAVANWDEDAVTMAVEAGARCLAGVETSVVDSVIVASTTFPYAEKQAAALVAEALDLDPSVETFDVASSLRAGTQALSLATDRVAATGRCVLVIAADVRPAPAESPAETSQGDGAAALLVGPDGPVKLRWSRNRHQTWLSHWRLAGEAYGHDGDPRFVTQQTVAGLGDGIASAMEAAAGLGLELDAIAVASPFAKDVAAARSAAGLPASVRVFGPELAQSIGYLGAPSCFISLIEAFEEARAGDVLVWVNAGDGVDAGIMTTERDAPFGRPLHAARQCARTVTYGRYLRLRSVMPDEPLAPFSSEIEQWRDAEATTRLWAQRCAACGHVAYPPQEVCTECHGIGNMSTVALPRAGHLVTFTVEHLFPNPERRLAMGVVDLGDDMRFYCPIADMEPDDLKIGGPVVLTFRRLHQGGSFVNYFWKATAPTVEVRP